MRKPRPRSPRETDASPPAPSRADDLAPLLLALLVFFVACAYAAPFMPDDSFISFRYAEHLADGHGLTFNIGLHPVEAYSNLLWILLCALLHEIGIDLPRWTPLVGVLIGAGSIYILWTMYRRRTSLAVQQAIPLLLLATAGPLVLYTVSGMETALFAFLLVLLLRFADDALLAPTRIRLAGLGTAGFLLSLTRPEGVIALPLTLAVLAWSQRADRRALRGFLITGAAYAAVTIIYHAWRFSYFGEWIPTPFLSKGGEGVSWTFGWARNLERYFISRANYSPPLGFYFLALGALGIVGTRIARGKGLRTAVENAALLLSVAFAVLYFNFVDWMPGMRYQAGLIGLLVLPIAHLHWLVPDSAWRNAAGTGRSRFMLVVAGMLIVSGLLLSHLKRAGAVFAIGSEKCDVPLGRWLGSYVPDDVLLAMGDVGAAPYYSRLRTIDIHPQSLTDVHVARYGFTPDYLFGKRPGVIILSVRGVFSARMDPVHFELYKLDRFRNGYRYVGSVRQQWQYDRSYWVFVRNDITLPAEAYAAFPTGLGKQHQVAEP